MGGASRILFLIHLLPALFLCNPPATRGLRLKLIPWDSPDSPLYTGNLTTLEKHQKVIRLLQHLEPISKYPNATIISRRKVQIPIHSHNEFRYSVKVKIGTPGKEVKLLLDTGSGFIWTQCSKQSNTYNSLGSSTYAPLPCNHRLCAKKICKCIKNQCVCSIVYGSGGVKYTLAGSLDTLRIPISSQSQKAFPEFSFGCSKKELFDDFSGILGLDRTPVSLVGQLRSHINGRFSYCLHDGLSYLTLGKDISNSEGKRVKTTPLIHTAYSALFLNLIDISVAGTKLGISPALFSLKNGGVFMDTGVRYTILTSKVYDKVNKAFASYFKRKKLRRLNESYFGTEPCYNVTRGFQDFPSMTFHFEGAADVVAEYTHIHDGEIACTAVTKGRRTVIGALQQWNTRFMYDINANVLKFYNDDCSNG